mmetsp:Transcript_18519/g.25656  ORF Transcript_18519/g.25656 Transcript_18519/m.25656 type:complete len:361 (+) Transcript_18519:79-1161(+)|eukprot:CAMPEP_0196582130 /NCGR_PEP_ID=MMETSP1081-20130531/37592_1 /TAXON_ID=36882 /ORGANISM="Pyramimonas amylifera, Strain CCMP720" /LENGTH=360 /DNA_ID=CAMNT_0041902613 /DNA_START=79 /DNA_END=1161 /DNA_ORIENTATION=+
MVTFTAKAPAITFAPAALSHASLVRGPATKPKHAQRCFPGGGRPLRSVRVRAETGVEKPAPVICIGEALWDSLPLGLFLGGAPVNVAQHMQQLGMPAACCSRVGDDALGMEIKRRLDIVGVSCDYLQVDDTDLPTGFVKVTMGKGGIPSYDIVRPSAWDNIQPTPKLLAAAKAAPAVIFGSLAQRDPASMKAIRAVMKAASKRVFDVNLRQPFVTPELICDCMQDLYLMKVNDEELVQMAEWIGCPVEEEEAAKAFAEKYNIDIVCVTRGGDGAALWISETKSWIQHPGYGVTPVDTVGSGDSFLARLLYGLLNGEEASSALAAANAMGAFVATQNGATPIHDMNVIQTLMNGDEEKLGV